MMSILLLFGKATGVKQLLLDQDNFEKMFF